MEYNLEEEQASALAHIRQLLTFNLSKNIETAIDLYEKKFGKDFADQLRELALQHAIKNEPLESQIAKEQGKALDCVTKILTEPEKHPLEIQNIEAIICEHKKRFGDEFADILWELLKKHDPRIKPSLDSNEEIPNPQHHLAFLYGTIKFAFGIIAEQIWSTLVVISRILFNKLPLEQKEKVQSFISSDFWNGFAEISRFFKAWALSNIAYIRQFLAYIWLAIVWVYKYISSKIQAK